MDFDHSDQEQLEEMVQRTRWGEVEDARRRVLDRLEAIDSAQFEYGGIAQESVSTLYQRAVQLYVQQVETILDPPEGSTTDWWDKNYIGGIDLPNGDAVDVIGLQHYVELDEVISCTVEKHPNPDGDTVSWATETVELTKVPPVGLHKAAFRATNRALADQGIEFDTRDRDENEIDLGNAL
jgi:hypothetical protein